ncbi:MAG: hypothetical protein HRT94_01060 [Alphaproteobacteria bacterium]|nr:hypothetical protein [Alphaproteobacteria bacterium]
MKTIAYFTDAYIGADLSPKYEGDISFHGKEWGLPLVRGMVHHANQNDRIGAVIHGGNEVFSVGIAPKEEGFFLTRNVKKEEYTRSSMDVRAVAHGCTVPFARTIGHHDPHRNTSSLGFTRHSHLFNQEALPNTQVIICQPDRNPSGNPYPFSYNPDEIISLVEQTDAPNILFSSSYAMNREELGISGSGYKYSDRTAALKKFVQERLRSGKFNSVLAISGHALRHHRARYGSFKVETCPSISQNHPLAPEYPCGFFCEVEEHAKTGELFTRPKLMFLESAESAESVVQDASSRELKALKRGFQNKVRRATPGTPVTSRPPSDLLRPKR